MDILLEDSKQLKCPYCRETMTLEQLLDHCKYDHQWLGLPSDYSLQDLIRRLSAVGLF